GFILCGAGLLLLAQARRNPALELTASLLSFLVFFSMLVVLLGYLYGTPLLYVGKLIPAALPTAIAFLGLSVGLILWAGPKHFPLRPFVGTSARAVLMRAFLPTTILVIIVSGIVYQFIPPEITVNHALMSALSALVSAVVVSLVVY